MPRKITLPSPSGHNLRHRRTLCQCLQRVYRACRDGYRPLCLLFYRSASGPDAASGKDADRGCHTQAGGFDFLGYHFGRGKHWPRKKSLMKLKEQARGAALKKEPAGGTPGGTPALQCFRDFRRSVPCLNEGPPARCRRSMVPRPCCVVNVLLPLGGKIRCA